MSKVVAAFSSIWVSILISVIMFVIQLFLKWKEKNRAMPSRSAELRTKTKALFNVLGECDVDYDGTPETYAKIKAEAMDAPRPHRDGA